MGYINEDTILTSALSHDFYAQFLEKLSDQDFRDYAKMLALTEPAPPTIIEEYLLCDLKQGRCILPMATLRAVILSPHQFTHLPATPSWMLGLTAWQGETIAVIDLSAYLVQQDAVIDSSGLLLIASASAANLGLFVSNATSTTFDANQLLSIEQSSIWYPHASSGAAHGLYADALLLDIPTILNNIIHQIKVTISYE